MSPGGYLRGAAALEGPPEIVARSQTYQKSVYIAVTFLALLQLGCTLGLFLYVKMEPRCICEKECDKERLKSCEVMKETITATVKKEIQAQSARNEPYVGNAPEVSSHPRNLNHQTWPVAHLTYVNSTETSNQGIEQLFSWNDKEGWAHLQNMIYRNGTLTVLQDGYYFIYANICFRRHKAALKISQNPLQLMLYVNKLYKNGKQKTLLKGGKTEIWSNDSLYNFYSVYKGGVFKLVAGEGILIKASNTALIDLSQEATYFGAFKILDIYL
ncbi:PREDICTED: tumor necrosis factor ligand superfamily member 11 [Nanorana parkeri]|uniref:tumor necrosis factor ligand superfamily member 11 n=1 Tax=Nanorana parkeri TaxID=125878 RepID=UPI000854E527|nr:PREDICTED: tumor necrosis factor ligand superfamily member 11 [Nanorana parkeri]